MTFHPSRAYARHLRRCRKRDRRTLALRAKGDRDLGRARRAQPRKFMTVTFWSEWLDRVKA